jgi:hypothetical protein
VTQAVCRLRQVEGITLCSVTVPQDTGGQGEL